MSLVPSNDPTGPTEYRANPYLSGFTVFAIIVNFTTKVACVIFVLLDDNLRTNGMGFYLFFTVAYIFSIFNVWLLKMMHYRPYETLMRFDCKNFIVTPFPYLYCLDQGITMFSPVALKHFEYTLPGNIAIGNSVFIMNLASFLIVKYANTRDYLPLENNSKYSLSNWTEENVSKEKCVSIKESGSFKIVIVNAGEESIDSLVTVNRTVSFDRPFWKRFLLPGKETVSFETQLRLMPGTSMTLIPITHSLNGGKDVNLRSFGHDRGNQVETSVYLKRESRLCVRRVEQYQASHMV